MKKGEERRAKQGEKKAKERDGGNEGRRKKENDKVLWEREVETRRERRKGER